MIRRLVQAGELAAALELLRTVASDDVTFSPQWLSDSAVRVVAQESGRHLEPDEAPLVSSAFRSTGAETLLAITNDPVATTEEAYETAASEDDLAQLSDELVGVNFLLTDATARHCILFTAYDFKLIAGSVGFIRAVVGDPAAARAAFMEFAEDQPGALRATATRAAEYMDWLGPR